MSGCGTEGQRTTNNECDEERTEGDLNIDYVMLAVNRRRIRLAKIHDIRKKNDTFRVILMRVSKTI